MQAVKSQGARHLNATPDRGLEVAQDNLELIDVLLPGGRDGPAPGYGAALRAREMFMRS